MRVFKIPERDTGGDQFLEVTVNDDPYVDEQVLIVHAWGHPMLQITAADQPPYPMRNWSWCGPDPYSDGATRWRDAVINFALVQGWIEDDEDNPNIEWWSGAIGGAKEHKAFDAVMEGISEHGLDEFCDAITERYAWTDPGVADDACCVHVTDEDNFGYTLSREMLRFFNAEVEELPAMTTDDGTLVVSGWIEEHGRVVRFVDRG